MLSGTLASLPSSARADSVRTSALPPGSENLRGIDLPQPLSTADAARYRAIFALQKAGRWAEADRAIAQLKDRLLIGAVAAQRYLHKSYPASYGELADWLEAHGDEPEAKAIYALALKRRPADAPAPARPAVATLAPRSIDEDADEAPIGHKLSAHEREQARLLRAEIRTLAGTEPRRAELMLAGYDAKQLLTASQQDELRTLISAGYLAAGKDQQALMLSAATHSPAYAAAAHWQAGLAAWRLGRYREAGPHFQAAARAAGQSSWTTAAAAFWAARVELRNHHPELFSYWLGIAAEHPRTFYGVIARRLLGGVDSYLSFDTLPFTDRDAAMLADTPAGHRALALLQAGQASEAEEELKVLAARAPAAMVETLVAVADRANMPALSLQLAGRVGEMDGRHHDHALYPLPRWTPLGGFTVDRALLYAVMRQESQFVPHVQSSAGAVGLMQLMPATAHAMARRSGVPLEHHGTHPAQQALAEPELNLALAQEYINSLIEDDHIGDNLVLIAAAYNSGPGALQRWQSPALSKDPLLFIESIPSQQTRVFTQRVLANYWIYRQRLGQPSPDLDALAAGQWPTYTALDNSTEPERRHAENR